MPDQLSLHDDLSMAWLSFNRQMFNPSIVKHNVFDAHIATAKNSGTHWIKYVLSLALAQIYDLPEPKHIKDDSIIGHPKNKPVHKNIPQIALTHSHPHYVMRIPFAYKTFNIPKCICVVRDPKDLMVSFYEKHKGAFIDRALSQSDVSFAEYLRVDINRKHGVETLWGVIRFFNAWGAVLKAAPDHVLLVRYEDLKANPFEQFMFICNHIGIKAMTEDILNAALTRSSKQEMKKRLDKTENMYERTVNIEERQSRDWYSDEDWEFFTTACQRYLKYDFGYG